MTREKAKEKLIAYGNAEPTEEQITSFLNDYNAQEQANKATKDSVSDLQKQISALTKERDELQNQSLSDVEKVQKENESLQSQIKALTETGFKSEAKAILKGAGLEDADIEALIPGMIADTLENTQARANAYVATVNKVRENAIKEHDKDVLDKTKTPGGNTNPDESKTEAEKIASSIGKTLTDSNKGSADIISAYTK